MSPTRTAVKKAGSVIRKVHRGELVDAERYLWALETLEDWRSEFQHPLVTANMGLRSFIRTTGCTGTVSQRLKRMPTIIEKITVREPTLPLADMHDVGGCRAVVQNMDELRRLEDHILKRQPTAIVKDYIHNPRSSGYWSLHLIVTYHGTMIEFQLRTPFMHQWAEMVESHSIATGTNYKQDGDSQFQDMARLASEIMQLEEYGQPIPNQLMSEYRRAYRAFTREPR